MVLWSPISFNAAISLMKYGELLHPWVIVCALPNMQNLSIRRFRRRNDAEECLKALRRLSPTEKFIVMFDASTKTKEQN